MLKTNRAKLPILPLKASVAEVKEPNYNGYLDINGNGVLMTGPGGICRNFKVGDRCNSILGHHIVPGVCLKGANDGALINYAPTGTPVTKCGGEAKGYVIGGCSYNGSGAIAAAFPEKDILTFEGDEQFLLICESYGLRLEDYPSIVCHIHPDLLEKVPVKEENGRLLFPVAKILPEKFAGYLGAEQLSVLTSDAATAAEAELETLCVGDFVMFTDIDHTWGGAFLRGAATIGIVTDNGACHVGGGPTVSVLFSSKDSTLGGYVSDMGNIARYYEEGKEC